MPIPRTPMQRVEPYNQVKRQAADLDATEYQEAKNRFIRKVLQGLTGRSTEQPDGGRFKGGASPNG